MQAIRQTTADCLSELRYRASPWLDRLAGVNWLPYALVAMLQVAASLIFLTTAISGDAAGFERLPLDEAWSRLVYARNLAEHFQLAFNPGEPEAGATSPLWVALAGAAWKVLGVAGVSLPATAKVLGIAAAAGTAMVVLRIVSDLTGRRRVGIAAGAVTAVEPGFASAAVSGMETPLFALLALGGAWAYMQGRLRTSGGLLTLTVLARPEGYVIVGLVLGAEIARKLWRRDRLDALSREDVREAVALFVPVAAVTAAWAAWNLSINGTLVPNEYLVRNQSTDLLPTSNLGSVIGGYYHQTAIFSRFIWPLTVPLVVAGAWWLLRTRRFSSVPLALFVPLLGYALSAAFALPEGEWTFADRHLLDPGTPFIVVMLFAGLVRVWVWSGRWRATHTPADPVESRILAFDMRVVLAAVIVLPFVMLPFRWQRLTDEYSWDARRVHEVNVAMAVEVADWFSALDGPDTVGGVDAGALRYFIPAEGRFPERIYDLGGHNTHEAIGRPPLEFAVENNVDLLVTQANIYADSWPGVVVLHEIVAELDDDLDRSVTRMYALRDDGVTAGRSSPVQFDTVALGLEIIDRVDPGNAAAPTAATEEAHGYRLEGEGATVTRRFKSLPDIVIEDDARTFAGAEEFTVASVPGKPLVVIKRYDAGVGGRYRVFASGVRVGEWELAPKSFIFGEDRFEIPAGFITDNATTLRFEVLPAPAAPAGHSFHYWILVDSDAAP